MTNPPNRTERRGAHRPEPEVHARVRAARAILRLLVADAAGEPSAELHTDALDGVAELVGGACLARGSAGPVVAADTDLPEGVDALFVALVGTRHLRDAGPMGSGERREVLREVLERIESVADALDAESGAGQGDGRA